MDPELPAYSVELPAAGPAYNDDIGRSAQFQGLTHEYSLGASLNPVDEPWATLNLTSSAKLRSSLPLYFEGDQICGILRLYLRKGDPLREITVGIVGKLSTSTSELKFYSASQILWSRSDNESTSSSTENRTGKLKGVYSWPFKLSLQNSTQIQGVRYRLPETFIEKNWGVTVRYELCVKFDRSWFRKNSYLRAAISYIPKSTPPPMTLMRRRAYGQNHPLPGPEIDVDGWEKFNPNIITGHFGANKAQTKARLTFWIARPLIYTRGSAIPCILEVQCRDVAGLDRISTGHFLPVRLQRRLQYTTAVTGDPSNQTGRDREEEIAYVASAVWFPSPDRSRRYTHRLNGEIRLPRSLTPTTFLAHFSVEYSVVLCPSSTSTSRTSIPLEVPLLEQRVEIVTSHAAGERPRPYLPPGYEFGEGRDGTENLRMNYSLVNGTIF